LSLSVLPAPAFTTHLLAQTLLAQTTQTTTSTGAAATQPAGKAPSIMDFLATPMFPLLLGIIVLYVFMFRSKKNQERKTQQARDAMKRGDRVQTIGGILGKVVEVEDSKVLLKVDENSNTKIWFSRNAIHRVITEEKAEATK
jgi:preprotein translocase subunit YajC